MEYGTGDFFALLGGLAIFIYGMKMMSEGIQKVAGSSLRKILSSITSNKFSALFVGFGLTTMVQSSSASTVMVVSFVNAGLMKVRQAIGVIMGANIGTTTTLWLVSLLGFSKFSISSMALPAAAIGVPMLLFGKRKYKYAGEFIFGFGLLFYGLSILKSGVPDYKHNPEALHFLEAFNGLGFASVLIFIVIGTLLTIVVQSSSAASAITIALVFQGIVTFEQGAAMILGENIGTTITAYLAAIVGNIGAKRAARGHLLFNIIGVAWMLVIFYWFIDAVDYFNMNVMGAKVSVVHGDLTAIPEESRKYPLALFHTGFNIVNSLLLIWFIPQIEKIVLKWVPDKEEDKGLKLLGNQFVETPELAILEAKKELSNMGKVAEEMVADLKEMTQSEGRKVDDLMTNLQENEDKTDKMEVNISSFLVEVAQQNSSDETSVKIIRMMEASDDIESIGDICYQTGVLLERKQESEVRFGGKMTKGISEMFLLLEDAVRIMRSNVNAEFNNVDLAAAQEVENKINTLRDELKKQNLKRLEKKEDKLQSAIVFRDVYNSLEKVADKVYQVSQALAGDE